jgi:hypothetical protein
MRVTQARRWAFLLAASITVATPYAQAQQAQQQPSKEALDEARIRYERATQLYAEGDYKLAIIEFNRAYELAPNYKVLFNIGQVNLQLGNYAAARRAFEKYLKDGGAEIPAKRKADVEKELVGLKNRTAHVTVVTDVEGADITVDGTTVGTSPLKDPLLVDTGQRTIAAKKQGRIGASRAVTLAGADEVKIEFELPEEPAAVTGGGTGPAIRERETIIERERASSYVWVPWLITGALAAGATVAGIFALGAADDLDTERGSPAEPGQTPEQKQAAIDDSESKVRNLAITTDVLAGSAVIAGAIAVVYTISDATSEPKKSGSRNQSRPSVGVGAGLGSVVVVGKF